MRNTKKDQAREERSAQAQARIHRRKRQRGGMSRREAQRLRALSEAYAPIRRVTAEEQQARVLDAINKTLRWRASR